MAYRHVGYTDLNGDFGGATVFTEDICSDAFEHFTKRTAAKEHGEFDLIACEVTQRRHIFHCQRRSTTTDRSSPCSLSLSSRIPTSLIIFLIPVMWSETLDF